MGDEEEILLDPPPVLLGPAGTILDQASGPTCPVPVDTYSIHSGLGMVL